MPVRVSACRFTALEGLHASVRVPERWSYPWVVVMPLGAGFVPGRWPWGVVMPLGAGRVPGRCPWVVTVALGGGCSPG